MLSYVFYFLLFVISLIMVWWYHFTSTRFYKLCSKIPGPPGLPVIGNVHQVCGNVETFARSVMKYSQKYYPTAKGFIGNICFVALNDPDDIHTVLSSPKVLSKCLGYHTLTKIMGNELFAAPATPWKKYRLIANPGFSNTVIRSYIGIFNEKSKMLIDILKKKTDGNPFNVHETISVATLDAIIETSLGIKMNFRLDELMHINDSIEKAKKIAQYLISSPWYWWNPIYNRSAISKDAIKVRECIQSFIKRIITDKVRKYETQEECELDSTTENVTTRGKTLGYIDHVFRYIKENNEEMTSEEITDNAASLMITGSDTPAFTMGVCLMLLGLHQNIQDKVVQELQDIFGDDFYRPFEFEDLHRMEYTEQVIKETTRLFPGGYLIGRRLEEDIEITGYTLPAGANVLVFPFSLHRDPKYFPNPLEFDPDRFSPENSRDRHSYCFIPFATGPRMCLGHYYAMTHMKMFISDIVRHYEILPYGSRQAMEEDVEMAVILNLKHGCNICIKPRNK